MIKINLAKRRAHGPTAAPSGAPARLNFDLSKFQFDGGRAIEALALPVVRKLGFLTVVCVGAYLGLSYYQGKLLEDVEVEITKLTTERDRLRAEKAKSKDYAQKKASLEADEKIIRAKIETVEKLIADRETPPKVLISVASSMPPDVWLTKFTYDDKMVAFAGQSLGFVEISDFMKSIGESAYFEGVTLGSSTLGRDDQGAESAQFEMTASRRSGL